MADSADEKSEEPTPKKLSDARNKGNVAKSKEFANFVIFAGMLLSLYFAGGMMLRGFTTVFKKYLSLELPLVSTVEEFWRVLGMFMSELMWILAPLFTAVMFFGVASYLVQFGILFTSDPLTPKISKINPLEGLKRIFSKDTLVELIKSVLKVICLGSIIYFLFISELQNMLNVGSETVGSIFMYYLWILAQMALATLLFMAVLGIADFAYQKWSFHQKQKMTLKEVKDENKNREGDPHVKARVRQIQREVARARMMDEVPQADVVVANPTHVAVALKYKRGEMDAPVVVAKGAGHIALKIKELAILSDIPVLEKRDLARFLYKNISIGQPVPEALYSAVAEVLAYVYKIKRKYSFLGSLPKHALRGEA